MFTTIYAFLALPILYGLFYLLAVVRIWRLDRTLAVLSFFFVPVGLYAMVRYWSVEQDNPRVPILVSFGALALWIGLLAWGLSYNPPDYGQAYLSEDSSLVEEDPIAEKLRLAVAVANLPWRVGEVDIPAAQATIDVPEHFRFVSAEALREIGATLGAAPQPQPIGWLVHETVNLTDDSAWFIEIEWFGKGFVSADSLSAYGNDALLATMRANTARLSQLDDEDDFDLVRLAEPPVFDAGDSRLTWVEEIHYPDENANLLDCYAIKLGRGGALMYSIMEAGASRQELCLRSVRLAAGRSRFNEGQAYADYSRLFDAKADFDLVGLVTGEFALPD
jgi:uncharacterized membrane-anchored protein